MVYSQGDVSPRAQGDPIRLIPSVRSNNDCGKIDTVFVINLWEFRFDIAMWVLCLMVHVLLRFLSGEQLSLYIKYIVTIHKECQHSVKNVIIFATPSFP